MHGAIFEITRSAIGMRDKRPDTVLLPKRYFNAYQKYVKDTVGDKTKMYYAGYPISVELGKSRKIEYFKDAVCINTQ